MNRISSVTEKCLFNSYALDFLSPTDFKKRSVNSRGYSALEALINCQQNPYSNLKNDSYWHYANKCFLLTPLKVAYISFVTFTFSRLGVPLNGCLTSYSYINYKLASYENKNEEWEKTKNYADAFLKDLVCAVGGPVLTKIFIESSFYTLHFSRIGSLMGKYHLPVRDSIISAIISLAGVAFGLSGLLALQDTYCASKFFARSQEETGMYLSLSLRKKLGLVSQNGGILPFSHFDQIEYKTTYNIKRRVDEACGNYKLFLELIINAEIELIETIVKYNEDLPSAQNIPFEYPFNGEKIASSLELSHKAMNVNVRQDALTSSADRSLFSKLSKIRSLHLKINFLKEIFKNGITLTDPKIEIEEPKSYISEEWYVKYFKTYAARPDAKNSGKNFAWGSVEIDPVNPDKVMRPTNNTLEEFNYDVAVNIWCCKNNKTIKFKSFRELLGLTKESSYNEYVKRKRKYLFAIHSDKNKSDKIADELSKCLIEIIMQLSKEYEQGTACKTT